MCRGPILPPSLIDVLDIYDNAEESDDKYITDYDDLMEYLMMTMSDLLLLVLPYLFHQIYLKSIGQHMYKLCSCYDNATLWCTSNMIQVICKFCLIRAMEIKDTYK